MIVKRIQKFLHQPYPYYFRGNTLWAFAALIFVLGLSFNYFFRPFNVNVSEHKMNYFWISFLHTVVPMVLIGIFAVILSFIVKNEEKWTIKKEMLFFITLFLSIGIGQFLIRDIIYDNPNNWSFGYFFEEIRNTCMVGLLFSLILVPLNYIRLLKQRVAGAGNLAIPEGIVSERSHVVVPIRTNTKSDDFTLNVNDFISAKAEGNYVEIYVKSATGVEKSVKRMTIKELEQQLKEVAYIFKSHRSYLINMTLVEKINGNAQGYKISLKGMPHEVPVSRTMISDFESQLQHI